MKTEKPKLKKMKKLHLEKSFCWKCWFYRSNKTIRFFYINNNGRALVQLCRKCVKELGLDSLSN